MNNSPQKSKKTASPPHAAKAIFSGIFIGMLLAFIKLPVDECANQKAAVTHLIFQTPQKKPNPPRGGAGKPRISIPRERQPGCLGEEGNPIFSF